MRNGKCTAHPTSGRRTFGRESSYWPTVAASDGFRMRLSLATLKKTYAAKREDPERAKFGSRVLCEELAALDDRCLTPEIAAWMMGFPRNWTAGVSLASATP